MTETRLKDLKYLQNTKNAAVATLTLSDNPPALKKLARYHA
jgi:hypothetical protein